FRRCASQRWRSGFATRSPRRRQADSPGSLRLIFANRGSHLQTRLARGRFTPQSSLRTLSLAVVAQQVVEDGAGVLARGRGWGRPASGPSPAEVVDLHSRLGLTSGSGFTGGGAEAASFRKGTPGQAHVLRLKRF